MDNVMYCCPHSMRDAFASLAEELYPGCTCTHVVSADDARETALFASEPLHAALVGFSERGVSDINLAAALRADGCTGDIVLVVASASGSLRSRAKSAQITRVIELNSTPPPEVRAAAGEKHGTHEAAAVHADRVHAAPLVVFCSGRGGQGKTAIVAAAALIAQSWGMRVALVDLDLANGNLYSCFGLARGGELQAPKPGEHLSFEGCMQVAGESMGLWGPCRLPEQAEAVSPAVGALLEHARTGADLVLVDTSSTTTDAVAEALQRADRAVLVYDGRRSSLAALARMGALAVRLGVARTRIMRLENHADPYSKPDFALGRAEMGLEVARPLRVFEGGSEVSQLASEGRMADLVGFAGDFAESVASSLAQILVELGCLPTCDAAQRAAKEPSVKRRIWPFSRAREAG